MLTPRPPARPRTSITSTTSLPAAPPAGPKGATKVGIATHAFTAEQSADFKEVFTEADTDGSGSIDRDELRAVMTKCGMDASDTQISEMLKAADTDLSGGIDFVEFLNIMWGLQRSPSERELRAEMFALLDDNLDGYVEAADIREAISRSVAHSPDSARTLPDADLLARMVAEVAADGKRLNADDFTALLRKLGLPKAGGAGGSISSGS